MLRQMRKWELQSKNHKINNELKKISEFYTSAYKILLIIDAHITT